MNNDTDLQALTTILQHAISMHEASEKWVEISPVVAEGILAILRSLPNSTPKRRPKEWTYFDEQYALHELNNNKPIRTLARQMEALTGQLETSARRRLREMKHGSRLKKPKANKKKDMARAPARGGRQK